MDVYKFDRSYQMFEEAKKLVPNGIYGPRTPNFLTYGSYPCFLERGKGSHIWDVDGNEYVDYMCSFGTNILGLCHEEVDQAAREQMARGDCFTLPSNRWNEMAAFMVDQIEGQDWVMFGKNGSDVTSLAITVARAHTGKNKVIVAAGAYHGAHFWCTHATTGIPAAYQSYVAHFEYNNWEALQAIIAQGDVAAIMLTPYQHGALSDQVMPRDGFYRDLRAVCDRENIVLIMDDIRCGFRLHPNGSHCFFGAEPDLICFGKAMANGYPIAVLTGKESLRGAAGSVFFTGTHFFSAVPMAAAIACIKIINREGVVERVNWLGNLLRDGILEQAATYELPVVYSGHPALPFMRFATDTDFSINRYFCGEAAKRGVFLHPHHNWFLSNAHTEADIKKTLEVTETCFRLTKQNYFA